LKLSTLGSQLGCQLLGADVEVARLASLERAGPGELSFVAQRKFAARAASTRASALIVPEGFDSALPRLVSSNPYLSFARALALLQPTPRPAAGVHATAWVDPSAELGAGVYVGPYAVVGAQARVGAGCVLHAHVIIYPQATLGPDCLLHAGAQVREGCRLGARVVLQNGAIVGSDGFGFARDEQGRYEKIPQVGIVVIEDDVEIGALTAIDRAALDETRIGRGCKLDNLVQIGHSVTLGPDSVLAAQVGIAGSTRLGARVTLAGQVGVNGHVEIGDDVIATGQSGLTADLPPGACVSGTPAIPNRDWLKAATLFARLPGLNNRLRALEAQVARLLTPR
jgi:UDP-3-O-[3-hydroxymyristoyl] glucosamine N-acyltransferase